MRREIVEALRAEADRYQAGPWLDQDEKDASLTAANAIYDLVNAIESGELPGKETSK